MEISAFLLRDAMHKRGLCHDAVSVCVCVCHVRELCQNEQRYLPNFFTVGQPHHSSSSLRNIMAVFRLKPPNAGVECRWGRQKSLF